MLSSWNQLLNMTEKHLYLSVSLQVLPDGHSLLDQVVQVLGQVWGQTFGLQDPQDLVASDKANLGHTVGVSENHTCQGQQTSAFKDSPLFKIKGLNIFLYVQTKSTRSTTE